ncbi:hypothetical protein [Paenibacillus sp. GCM10028914]|uniref:hypothetical protein n=1 Tax=Paenibacillus sp. GCM10028914 TaxID=3273416 RepID=UPI00361542A5
MKRISMVLTLAVFVTFVFSGFASNSYASSNTDESFKELSYSFEENNGDKEIQGVYQDVNTGDTVRFDISESGEVREVMHYINDILVVETTYNKASGQIISTDLQTGETTTYNVDDLVTPLDRQDEGSTLDSPSSGYNFVKTKYNSTWNQYGSLYKKTTVKDSTYIEVNFGPGTALGVILSAIDIIYTKGGLTSILKMIGITFSSIALDTAWYGILDAKKYLTQIEVFSQNKLGLRSEQYILEVKINGVPKQVHDGGDGRTYDQMIDDAIYNVIILG